MKPDKKVRIIPVFRKGKEHAGYADGYIVHPDDRDARKLPKPKTKRTREEAKGGG